MDEGRAFEIEVQAVARELWPEARYQGAAMVDDRERDGVFVTEWVTHLVEATISRRREKAAHDIDKLVKHRRKLIQRGVAVRCWFVTKDEPTADQRSLVTDRSVTILSLDDFRKKLIDSAGYIRDRRKYPWGSARDPKTGDVKVDEKYVPLNLIQSKTSMRWAVGNVVDHLRGGGRSILLGDYGAGKSMTLREIFNKLADEFHSGKSRRFPIHLNLRDHHGQTNPAEALERHAREVGFDHPNQLVRAWRAGYADLLLDGFDEMATRGWVGPTLKIRDIRKRSVGLVRKFVQHTPRNVGLVVAGRLHFFDSVQEMQGALGITDGWPQLQMDEFNDEQIELYLRARGWYQGLPAWLPARPLLLAYLAGRDLLREALEVPTDAAPASAWDVLLSLVSEREAEVDDNIDGATVRRVVEHVASKARLHSDGVGPLEFHEIEGSFRDACGYPPDEQGMTLLRRLPGLGPTDAEDGSRKLIDADFADAAGAGDVVRFAEGPYAEAGMERLPEWAIQLGHLGIELAALRLSRAGIRTKHIAVGARKAAMTTGGSAMAVDLARITSELGGSLEDGKDVVTAGVAIRHLRLDDPDVSLASLVIEDSVIDRLEVPRDGMKDSALPRFHRCIFGTVEGRSTPRDLPQDRFQECEFGEFSEGGTTTAAILKSSLPLGTRVLLTILKKVYAQDGRGRKEGALFRGMAQHEKGAVPDALALLEREGLAVKGKAGRQVVWLPVRSASPRVFAILEAPTTVKDEILKKSALLS